LAWWIAEKGTQLELLGRNEVSEASAKTGAVAASKAHPGTIFQVRYRVNANGMTEVRWEALDGNISEITGEARRHP
jgi:hypothetical protein